MFNIIHLASFPDISNIFYLLASEVKVACFAVLFHSIISLFNLFHLPFEKFIYPSFQISTHTQHQNI